MSEMSPPLQFAPDWSGAEALPVTPINQIVSSVAPSSGTGIPDGILVYLGYATPPMVLGGQAEFEAMIEALDGHIRVDAAGRFFMARERAQELADILRTSIEQYDQAVEEARINHA